MIVPIFKKITITVTEVVLIQVSLLTVLSKQKNRNNTRSTIASSYNSKVWSTQSTGVQFSPCLGHGKWYYIITCLGNGKVFAGNSKLINVFDAQLFHENVKWIICAWDLYYILKMFLLFHTTLLKCFIYNRVTVTYILHGATIPFAPIMNWGKMVSFHLIRRKFPFFQVIYYMHKRTIYHKKTSCLPNWFIIIGMLLACETSNFFCLIFLVRSSPSRNT